MKIFFLLLLSLFTFIYTPNVYAHLQGVSIFKINKENTKIAPAGYTNSKIKVIPPDSDLAPQTYASHQFIYFELDTTKFITPPSIFEKTEFIWDFGDGSPKQTITNGTKNNHVYTKNGTYLLTIYADYTTAGFDSIPEPQLLQSVIIEIGKKSAEDNSNPLTLVLITIFIGTSLLIFIYIMTKYKRKRRKK